MPELPEIEAYRRAVVPALGRRVASVEAPDAWWARRAGGPQPLVRALGGRRLDGARRHGKLLVVDLDDGRSVGLRFGMTGLLEVDGVRPIDQLLSGSARRDPAWVRLALHLDDGGSVVVVDPRRLGGVELDPDLDALGPDAASITEPQLGAALVGAASPLKARLLDQARIAGVGNLLADEALWRAGLHPGRAAGSLDRAERRRLARHLRDAVADAIDRGGSHTGRLMGHRRPGGTCPRDGTPLRRSTVGGRTTWWCPRHQGAGAAAPPP